MDAQEAVDLGREAIVTTMTVASPILLAGMLVGLLLGLLQAVTQVQEQAVSFVPKLLAMVVVVSLMLPWLINQMVQYSHDLIVNIPASL